MSKLKRLSEGSQPTKLSRRSFLVGATTIGVTMAFAPVASIRAAAGEVLEARQFEPTVWFSIDAMGLVHVNVAEAEMGQHVGSALARIVAEELEVNWHDVRLNYVEIGRAHV